jgi:hypothetical protein
MPTMTTTKVLSFLTSGMFYRDTVVVDGMRVSRAKNIYPETTELQFLLREGQCLVDDTFHNAGWYNKDGTKIGWGDLSKDQLKKIPSLLPPGELFFVISEGASYWELPKGMDQIHPGIDYVITKALAVATPQGWYTFPSPYDPDQTGNRHERVLLRGAVECHKINRAWVRGLAATAQTTEINLKEGWVNCPVEEPGMVEELIPFPWSVGDNWTTAQPSQLLPDGRWHLFLYDEGLPAGYTITELSGTQFQVTGPDFRQAWATYLECRQAAIGHHMSGETVSLHDEA